MVPYCLMSPTIAALTRSYAFTWLTHPDVTHPCASSQLTQSCVSVFLPSQGPQPKPTGSRVSSTTSPRLPCGIGGLYKTGVLRSNKRNHRLTQINTSLPSPYWKK
uniref:Uncharacterized protein n=1 Tax=Trypanosoma congolense (strain IL3000) TaxID=1068625 RepID=G0UNC4_TRYCI|nr:hypothetical protein, unlikely [Trypanosoma congolense IL3000]